MEKIEHFSHRHPLKFFPSEFFQDDDYPEVYKLCGACDRAINSSAYGCNMCNHFIHKSCAELKRHLKHPFHPKHTLALPNDWNSKSLLVQCNACGLLHQKRLGYSCSECEFNLDLVCASLSQTSENTSEMHLIDQPHPLFICNKPADYNPRCSCCRLAFSETDSQICVCIECSHLLHQSCASLKEIRHPFHIEHALTLIPPPQYGYNLDIKCNACSLPHRKGGFYMFHCKQCYFALDFQCASLVPISECIGFPPEVQKRHLNHKHPLIECNNIEKFKPFCRGCGERFDDSIFVCLDCGMLLDRRCADLPLEVKHPCHPQHPFQLHQTEMFRQYECWLCHAKLFSKFAYSCSCNFYLEPTCAMTKPLIINCVFHEHPLAYISEKCKKYANLRCNECYEYCTEEFLHCVECRYSSHLRCYPNLPLVIKHSCHCDLLTLTYSLIKDDPDDEEDDEFYCNACEELRDLRHPTYYCEECHFVAHPRCVVSEILIYMETEPTQQSLGNVQSDTSLNYFPDEAAVDTASSLVKNLEKSENFDIEDEADEEGFSSENDKLEASTNSSIDIEDKEEETDSSIGDDSETSELSTGETYVADLDEAITMTQSKVDKIMVKVEKLIAKMERLKERRELLIKSLAA